MKHLYSESDTQCFSSDASERFIIFQTNEMYTLFVRTQTMAKTFTNYEKIKY